MPNDHTPAYTTLSSKGQLVLPANIRQAMHMEPGLRFEIQVKKDAITLKPLRSKTHPMMALAGCFYNPKQKYKGEKAEHDAVLLHVKALDDATKSSS